jgi:hypothetical protein
VESSSQLLCKELLGTVYGTLELGFLQHGDRKVPTAKLIGFIGHPKSMQVPEGKGHLGRHFPSVTVVGN